MSYTETGDYNPLDDLLNGKDSGVDDILQNNTSAGALKKFEIDKSGSGSIYVWGTVIFGISTGGFFLAFLIILFIAGFGCWGW